MRSESIELGFEFKTVAVISTVMTSVVNDYSIKPLNYLGEQAR